MTEEGKKSLYNKGKLLVTLSQLIKCVLVILKGKQDDDNDDGESKKEDKKRVQ